MRGWRSCRPYAITILTATTLVVGACRQYEPIDVWDPNRPVAPSSQPGRRAPGTVERGVVERTPADPARPPALPTRRGEPPSRPAPVSAVPPPLATPPLAAPAPARPAAAVGSVVVQRGETLFAISRRTSVPVRALIDANGLRPPYGLQAGQRIQVPATRFHEVQPGETLYSVSRRYGVAMSSLVRDNAMEAPYVVRTGERLKIPSSTVPTTETMVASAPPPAPNPVHPGPAAAAPATGQILVPPATAPSAPQTGFLTLPPGYAPDPVLPPSPPRPPPPAAGPDPSPPVPSLQAPPLERGAPPAVAALPPPAVSSPPARDGRGFVWPVRGQVVTRFGPTGRGLHNDGINIAAPRGTTVVAADSGVVAYAGNELRGFGNLLLVKHADGWITAYAHNEALLVKRGDRIRRGQPIARVGQTGNVGEPQLHFELRRGTRAVDPAEFLDMQSSTTVDPAGARTLLASLGR